MFNQKIYFVNIVAMSKNGIIGVDNKLPWRMKTELQEFSRSIKNTKLLMGRKTCESLPKKQNKELNFVLTSDKNFSKEGYIAIESLSELEKHLDPGERIYVIGGGSLYEQILDLDDNPNVSIVNEVTVINMEIPEGKDTVRFPIDKVRQIFSNVVMLRGSDNGIEWEKFLFYKN